MFFRIIPVVLALLFAGCASAVDKSEVEQRANPVKDLHKEIAKTTEEERNRFDWYSYEDGLIKARKEGKYVMVDFYTGWCKWCKKLDSDTYPDKAVSEYIKANFVPVKIDAESGARVIHEMSQITNKELADRYEVKSYPAVWFVDSTGARAKLLNGYLPPDAFLLYLKYIKSGKYKDAEFEDWVKGGSGR